MFKKLVSFMLAVSLAFCLCSCGDKPEDGSDSNVEKGEKLTVGSQPVNRTVSANGYQFIGLKADGSVVMSGDYFLNGNGAVDWTDIKSVAMGSGYNVGLKFDGTVVAEGNGKGSELYDHGQFDVDEWTDIIAVAAGYNTMGLKADGTVVTTKCESKEEIENWTDIVAIETEGDVAYGLKSDGTVVSASLRNGTDSGMLDVSGWTDIVALSAGEFHVVGLKADGTVVSTQINDEKWYYGQTQVDGWTDIIAVSAAQYHTVGLKADGTVVATEKLDLAEEDCGQSDVDGMKNIVAIAANDEVTLGIKADGSVVTTEIKGDHADGYDFGDWDDMKLPE